MKTRRTLMTAALIAAVAVGGFQAEAENAVINYSQNYAYSIRSDSARNYAYDNHTASATIVKNSFKFTTTITKQDFSSFDNSTTLGVVIGSLDVLKNLYDGKAVVSVATIGDAVAAGAASTGAVKTQIFINSVVPEKSKGAIQGYIIKLVTSTDPDTEITTTKRFNVGTVRLAWNNKKMTISVQFNESHLVGDANVPPTVMPFDLSVLTQWDRKFSKNVTPVSVTFGDLTYSATQLCLDGRSNFTRAGMLTSANGRMIGPISLPSP